MCHILIIQTNLLISIIGCCCIDLGTTSHVCNTLQGFQENKKLNDNVIVLLLGMEEIVVSVSNHYKKNDQLQQKFSDR